MKSMYEISQEALKIASWLEEGELTEEMETMLAISQEELQKKAINYGYVIKQFDSDIDAIDAEIKRLQGLKKSKENASERLKDTVKHAMQIYSIEKLETPTLKVGFRKSESVEIINESQIEQVFKTSKVVESINKTAIKEAIKSGQTVKGAILQVNFNLSIE